MALVISFLTDPVQAAAEMRRVVRPGGWVATYMWLAGGVPVEPIYKAMKSLGMPSALPPDPAASRPEAMQELWERTGLESIDTQVIRILVVYSDFDDFWQSNNVPIGPQCKLINAMPAKTKEQLRTLLCDSLPISTDGSIAYEAFANAVKGRVPE